MTAISSRGRSSRPPSSEDVARIVRLHENGSDVCTIARTVKRHPNTIKRALLGAGITPRRATGRGDRHAAARVTAEAVNEHAEYRRAIRPAHVTASEGTPAWFEQCNRAFARHMLAVLREEGRIAP